MGSVHFVNYMIPLDEMMVTFKKMEMPFLDVSADGSSLGPERGTGSPKVPPKETANSPHS